MENPFGKEDEELPKEDQEDKVELTSDLEVTTALDKPNEPANEEPESSTEDDTKEVVKSRKQQILEKHGGLESNVPINSPYWKMK